MYKLFISILYVKFPSLQTSLSADLVTVSPVIIATTKAWVDISVGISL